jgi:hypothetical protein
MKGIVCAVAALALAGAAAVAGAAPASDTKQVSVQGCVQAGVEASCLVVKDLQSGNLYNLLIKGAKPAIGTGIEFTGVPYDGVTMCMQGLPVQVTSWTRKDSLKCAKGSLKSVQ